MIRKFTLAAAASAMVALFAPPASADNIKLGLLTCEIEGGTALIIASHKGLSCTFKSSRSGRREHYTGMISKIGVDVGVTHQGSLQWAVFALSSKHKAGALAGEYLGATAEASIVAGGGANLLVGGFQRSFTLQPLSVQAQTGLNLALAVTSMRLFEATK
ncbi:DUF992 domain-containing protein [Mesorhizobium marinum]|uniref:DUF992 domain-containing protein n=1 Tax=Mesorhizobium marinum TaxID=3228790 RepID=A0ABV3QXT8_9HYPH